MPDRDLEHHLPPLLHQTAEEHIPMTTDLTSAVQRQIDNQPPRRPPGLPRALMATVGAVVVVGLFIALLAHSRPQGSNGGASTGTINTIGGGPTPTLAPLHCSGQTNVPAGLACPVTDQGITIQVTGANVSPIGSTIQIVVLNSAAKVRYPSILDDSLSDGLGHMQIATSASGNGKDPNHVIITMPFAPFPEAEMHEQLHLTFTITRLESMPPAPFIHGLWRSSFVVTPIPGTPYPIHTSPVAADGVSVQAQSLIFVPNGQTVQGNANGVRLDLTFTGLPAQTSIYSFQGWSSTTQVVCNGGPCNPSFALLTLPGWQGPAIGDLNVIPQNTTASTVGPSGMVQVALIYGGTGAPNGQPAILHLNNLRLLDSAGNVLRTLPNITLTMPLG
jgi:hypothetical protein